MCVRLNLPEWLTALSQPGVQNAQLTLSGSKAVASSNWLLTTVAYQLDGKRTYALEGVCYQTNDLLEAMKWDWGARGQTILRVDGGMTASDWTIQFLADILGAPVDRPMVLETTALGAAYLAGLRAGLLPKPEVFAQTWKRQKRFMPQMDAETRSLKLAGWAQAVRKPLT